MSERLLGLGLTHQGGWALSLETPQEAFSHVHRHVLAETTIVEN